MVFRMHVHVTQGEVQRFFLNHLCEHLNTFFCWGAESLCKYIVFSLIIIKQPLPRKWIYLWALSEFRNNLICLRHPFRLDARICEDRVWVMTSIPVAARDIPTGQGKARERQAALLGPLKFWLGGDVMELLLQRHLVSAIHTKGTFDCSGLGLSRKRREWSKMMGLPCPLLLQLRMVRCRGE